MSDTAPIKVYLAGRIRNERERFGIAASDVLQLSDRGIDYAAEADKRLPEVHPVPCSIEGREFAYTGPFTVANDHGTAHGGYDHAGDRDGFGTRSHGAGIYSFGSCWADCDKRTLGTFLEHRLQRQRDILRNAYRGIELCDHFFAWIDDSECYGTIAEIGYAAAQGKHITIGLPYSQPEGAHELWFPILSADEVIYSATPESAASAFILGVTSNLRQANEPVC